MTAEGAEATTEHQIGTSSNGAAKEGSLVLVQLGNGTRIPYFLVPATASSCELPTTEHLVTRLRSYLADIGTPEELQTEALELFSASDTSGATYELEDRLEALEHLYGLSVTAQVMLHELSQAKVTSLPSNLEIAQALLGRHRKEKVLLDGRPVSIVEILNLLTPTTEP